MTSRSLRASVLALATGFLTTSQAPAQQHPNHVQGFAADRVFQLGDLDNVNLFNGNLNAQIPIGGSFPVGGGLSYGLSLTYNGNVWDYDEVCDASFQCYLKAVARRKSNAGLGWQLTLGRLSPASSSPQPAPLNYESEDGSEHILSNQLHGTLPINSGASFSTDSTYLRHKVTGTSPNQVHTVEFPSGLTKTFNNAKQLTKIHDRFGNYVNVTYGSSPTRWILTDSVGRTQTIFFKSAILYGQVVDRVEVRAPGTTTGTYTFLYTNATIARGWSDPAAPSTLIPKTETVPLLTGLTLPSGRYAMTYDYGPSGEFSSLSGHLTSLKLPTNGSIDYVWTQYFFPKDSERLGVYPGPAPTTMQMTPFSRSTGLLERRLVGINGGIQGTWKYNPYMRTDQLPIREGATVVTDPLGHKTVHYFSTYPGCVTGSPECPSGAPAGGWTADEYGLPFTRNASDGTSPARFLSSRTVSSSGAISTTNGVVTVTSGLLRTGYVRYENSGGKKNQRLASSRTVYADDGNRTADVTYSNFDGLGHYRTTTLAGTFDSGNAKTTTVNYNPGRSVSSIPANTDPWVLETYDHQTVTQGATTFRSDFCFEPATGYLLRTRSRKGTTGGITANDLVSVFVRNAAGQTTQEQSFGGDLVTLGTTTDLCALALGTDVFRRNHTYQYGTLKTSQYSTSAGGLVLKTVDRTIDPTGAVLTDKDPSGVLTTYVYDTMGRLTQVKPAEDSWIGYTYTVPTSGNANVKIRRYLNGGWATVLTDEEVVFDDFGRVYQEKRRNPDATWSKQTTFYNALSHVIDVSEWEPNGLGHLGWTKYRNHDAFGRPGFVDPPEGSAHRVSFSYNGDRVVNRTAKVGTALVSGSVTQSSVTVTERYDRQGRLYQVVDPAGTATYGYDPAGRLTSVAMPNQNRFFAYDGRGLLTSETHPEKGTSGNGAVTYSRYDAMGNVGRRSDGPMSVDYVYDRAGRLLRINDLGTTTPVKVFTYGTGTGSTDRSAGKVKTADRYNYVTIGTTAYTFQVRETYTYGGRSGRTSKRDTVAQVLSPFVGSPESFTQTFGAYDHLGNLTSLSYPQCTHAACTAPSPRTVTFGYTDGRLSSVPGWAPTIAYHPNGMTKSIAHGNNVTTNLTNDDWSRPRPKVIATSGALNSVGSLQEWTTGTYAYDGSGNVIHVGTARYVYDGLSRLKSATQNAVLNGNALADKTQGYTYDPAGNLTSTTTNGVLVNSPSSATTNRLTGSVIYDAAGNLTSWNGNTYAYDRLGMMWKMKAGTLEHIYLYTADDERLWIYPAAGGGPSTWTLRDLGGKVLREYKNNAGTWSVNRDYVYGNGQLLGAAVSPTVNHYFHVDHLGTPRLITGADKKRVVYHAYYPFGQEATSPTLDTERMKFTGHERDLNAVTGTNPAADDLDYMHARFYNPHVGRFLSVDPGKDWSPPNPQSWNMYAYARGNPVKYVDPDGQAVMRATGGTDRFLQELSFDMATDVVPGPMLIRTPAKLGARALGPLASRLVRPLGSGLAERSPAVAQFAFRRLESTLKPGGEKLGTALSSDRIRQLPGGVKAANELFEKLTSLFGREAASSSDKVTKAIIPGVGEVQLRTVQSGDSFVATIDVKIKGVGIDEIKFLPE